MNKYWNPQTFFNVQIHFWKFRTFLETQEQFWKWLFYLNVNIYFKREIRLKTCKKIKIPNIFCIFTHLLNIVEKMKFKKNYITIPLNVFVLEIMTKKLTFRTALESLKKSIWSFWTCKKKWKKLNWENETKRRNKTLFRVATCLMFITAFTPGRRKFQWAHYATMPFLLMVDIVHRNIINNSI